MILLLEKFTEGNGRIANSKNFLCLISSETVGEICLISPEMVGEILELPKIFNVHMNIYMDM